MICIFYANQKTWLQFKADASKTESMVYCNVTEIDHYVRDVRLNFSWRNSRVTYLKR